MLSHTLSHDQHIGIAKSELFEMNFGELFRKREREDDGTQLRTMNSPVQLND